MDLRNHVVAGEESANICNNRALGDKFLKFGMVFGMGIVFSKSNNLKKKKFKWPLAAILDFWYFFLWPQKTFKWPLEQICHAVKYRKNDIT